jgi:hypothetical protein
VNENRPGDPLIQVAPGRTPYFERKHLYPAARFHCPNKVQIFHDGNRRHSPHGVERPAPYKNGLITVRQPHEGDSEAGKKLHHSQGFLGSVQP